MINNTITAIKENMKLGIMQPYFLPYIGYWQLINAVDIFVIYDNIQYTKKGGVNRNRYLLNGKDALFSINLKNASDSLNVNYIYNSVTKICEYLDIKTQIITSSSVDIDHSLKAEKKVLSICKKLNAETYINSIGGVELYSKEMFREHGVELKFIKPKFIEYKQFDNEFILWLSIIDVMMFNSVEEINKMLDEYELV